MKFKTLGTVSGLALAMFAGAGVCLAADTYDYTWTDAAGDHKWGTPGNWKKGEIPTAGSTVWLSAGLPEVVVDNDSAASFASVKSIEHQTNVSESGITRILLSVTTNVSLSCVLKSFASFRLANDVTVTSLNSTSQNFLGFNVLERGTFVLPQCAPAGSRNYQFGRFNVSNDATLVISPASCWFYQLRSYGTLMNPSTTTYAIQPSLTTPETPAIIAGPVVGKIKLDGNKAALVYGVDNPTLTFNMYSSAYMYSYPGFCGFGKFGADNSDTSSFGNQNAFSPEYDGFHFLYLGKGGETTAKTFSYSGLQTHKSTEYQKFPTTFDAGEHGGVTFTGKITPNFADDARYFAHRLVFQGSNTNECVLNCSFPIGHDSYYYCTNCTQYVTKRGSGIWRFAETDTTDYTSTYKKLYGVFAVEEGTLRFDSMAERGISSAIGFSRNLQREYKGAYNPSNDVDYAYLLGTAGTNELGEVVSLTEGKMEFSGSRASCATTRPFRLLGDGCIGNCGTSRIALGDFAAITNGEKTLRLDGVANDFGDALKDIRNGSGTVSVVKSGAGNWKITGELSFSGDLKVNGGTLTVSNPTNVQTYKWFRFTDRQNHGSSAWMVLGKLAFYDADGKRQGLNLTAMGQSSTGYSLPYCDYMNLPPGSIMFGRWGYQFYLQGLGYKLSRLSSDSATAVPFTTCCKLDSSQLRCIVQWDPDSYVPIVVRLPDATEAIASYDLASVPNRTATYCAEVNWPANWTLEGSPDGVFWDLLDTRTDTAIPENDNSWYSDGTVFTAGAVRKYDSGDATPKGFPIASARAPRTDTALANVRSVSVAAGATLVGEGRVRTLDALEVSASGMGTIEGFTLAETGSIDFTGVDETAKEIVIPADFSKLPDWMNLAGWSFTVNGEENAKFAMSVGPDGFRLCKKGLMLILR